MNKQKYQLGDFLIDPIPNSQNQQHMNCLTDSKEELLIRSWELIWY